MKCKNCGIEIEIWANTYAHVGNAKHHWGTQARYVYCNAAKYFNNPTRTFDSTLMAEPNTKEENISRILKSIS